jgi:hypothetical protein
MSNTDFPRTAAELTGKLPVLLLLFLLLLSMNESSFGQMFGDRQLGRPLSRRASPNAATGVADEIGSLRNQRFIRGNRSVRNFVGSDRREAVDFVGMEQAGAAAPAVRSAVAGLRPTVDRSASVNQPAAATATTGANTMYAPRLVVGFSHASPASRELQGDMSRRLRIMGGEVEVLVAGRTAILRGTVASAEDRDLAQILASFEPGISTVRNELKVALEKEVETLPPPPMPADQ